MPARGLTRLAGGGVALLFLLQLVTLLRAAPAWQPALISVRLAPGATVSLAPLARLDVARDAQGRWLLAAQDGAAAPTLLRHDAVDPLNTVALSPDTLILPGGWRLPWREAGASVAFAFAGSAWRYDGATLLRDGQVQPPCPDARWSTRLAAALRLARPLSFGGNLHCGNRLGIGGTLPDAATLTRVHGQYRITDLERRPRPLDGVQGIASGALRLAVDWQDGGATLLLRPQRRAPMFAAPAGLRLPEGVSWQWQARQLWPALPDSGMQQALAAAVAVAMLAALALALLAWATVAAARSPRASCVRPAAAPPWRARTEWLRTTLAASVCCAGLLALVQQKLGQPPAAALSLLLAALALATWLSDAAALTLTAGSAALLLGAGLLFQLELALGGGDLRYYHKTASLLAIGLGAITLWRMLPARWRPASGSMLRVEMLLAALALLALAGLSAQVAWGDETGVFDLQPVELAKLALAALTAHCLALRFGWHDSPRLARWFALGAPVLVFLALLALALVQVDDYSPLVLLAIWAGASALAYACCARRHAMTAALCLLVLGGVAAVALLRSGGAAALPDNFYGDRFQVWLAPSVHPHTGQQWLQGASAIAQGGLAGADHTLGLRALGLPAGAASAIPAVQDDFAVAFFLNRHGLLAGLLLWTLQATFLCGLLDQATAAQRAANAARAWRAAWQARFRCFALCGGAAFVGGHLLLSWGTNLAILPVMGQPMSFLSAGGSHLAFFLLPLLGLSAVSNEE